MNSVQSNEDDVIKADDEIKLYFKLTGFECDPSEISMKLGIEPTETWMKGESVIKGSLKIKESLHKHRESGWMVKSRLPNSAPYQEQFYDLMEIINSKKREIQGLPLETKKEIYCVVYTYIGRPDIYTESDMIKMIAELDASLGFDIFTFE